MVSGSTFDANVGSSSLYMEETDLEIYDVNVTNAPAETTHFLECADAGQLTLARVNLADTDLVTVGSGCTAFLYHPNRGDNATLLDLVTRASTSLSVTTYYYSYPCPAGKWSVDGLEHDDLINANDPTCSSNVAKCPDGCAVCNAGTPVRRRPTSIRRARKNGAQ